MTFARKRFDESCASKLASFFGSNPSLAVLEDACLWVVRCASAEAFFGEIRARQAETARSETSPRVSMR